jgi:hypothetical protein
MGDFCGVVVGLGCDLPVLRSNGMVVFGEDLGVDGLVVHNVAKLQ